ncbi:SDR family NAD(P)-dependent oxidoreductase [Pseudomonas sp. BMS12]|uniref:SDR family NAD(P)-dependent oxidoreductase n=1 Tax=Pseudomonas sp. BMS12 TaxID=1796033 RepID=UPI00083B6D57|nr:SDR family oxidoreductase [Pseudomonas sp. BMS12]
MHTTTPTVIITGASSGIGLAIAETFLAQGYNVVGNARNAARLEQTLAALNCGERFLAVAGDIAEPNTARQLVTHAVQRFGRIDVLVNNAGVFIAKPFIEYDQGDIAQLIATNLMGTVNASQAVAAQMIKQGSGRIVNVTASIALQPLQRVPSAIPILIKGGLNQLTRALALELAPHNIQVNAVAPGLIDTPMHTPETHEFLCGLQPAGRIGRPQEIADAVLHLSQAGFTSGAILPVDGGMSSGVW